MNFVAGMLMIITGCNIAFEVEIVKSLLLSERVTLITPADLLISRCNKQFPPASQDIGGVFLCLKTYLIYHS